MIDEGYHPMTMYFPLVVHGAMLIEPTESESKASLDLFIAALRDLALAAKRGDTARFAAAPLLRAAPAARRDARRAPAGAALDQARAAERGGGVGPGHGRSRSPSGTAMIELCDAASAAAPSPLRRGRDARPYNTMFIGSG